MSLISVKSKVGTKCLLYSPWTSVGKEVYNPVRTSLWVGVLAGVPIFKFEKWRVFHIPIVNAVFSIHRKNFFQVVYPTRLYNISEINTSTIGYVGTETGARIAFPKVEQSNEEYFEYEFDKSKSTRPILSRKISEWD